MYCIYIHIYIHIYSLSFSEEKKNALSFVPIVTLIKFQSL